LQKATTHFVSRSAYTMSGFVYRST